MLSNLNLQEKVWNQSDIFNFSLGNIQKSSPGLEVWDMHFS